MIEMTIDSVRINLATQQRVAILKAMNQDCYLFIWIAQPEAYAIAVHLQGATSPRPITHDLMKDLVEATGAKVIQVDISDFSNEIYYAQVILEIIGKKIAVDARPSDGIALAVRTKSPIFVAEQVLERAGVQLEQADTQLDQNDDSSPDPNQVEQKQKIEDTNINTELSN